MKDKYQTCPECNYLVVELALTSQNYKYLFARVSAKRLMLNSEPLTEEEFNKNYRHKDYYLCTNCGNLITHEPEEKHHE